MLTSLSTRLNSLLSLIDHICWSSKSQTWVACAHSAIPSAIRITIHSGITNIHSLDKSQGLRRVRQRGPPGCIQDQKTLKLNLQDTSTEDASRRSILTGSKQLECAININPVSAISIYVLRHCTIHWVSSSWDALSHGSSLAWRSCRQMSMQDYFVTALQYKEPRCRVDAPRA
ncbi:hypothetical protein BO82DRAFT_152757 [Aspergillus uvarum CBS 121591]|uniref:Uncharacterized protein n=1 Tax=Aspergillus uvarum CBS 121591 TaxID=1448315 RepID=A0A319C124_9EURO|nr:hypothetical protein BO82DRAFT_152757 [Aspergillus uvarum CBS 121591]PYH78774.1 hypothetical protein BO82DRAFT_152757 [Aspergillus uvarum CBS 121591]